MWKVTEIKSRLFINISGEDRKVEIGPKLGRFYVNSNGNMQYLNSEKAKSQVFGTINVKSKHMSGNGGTKSDTYTIDRPSGKD